MTQTKEISRGQEVAGIILQQLGGNKFMVMTGCKPQWYDGFTSCYKMTRNKIKAQWMKITLDASDTYTMEFSKMNIKTNEVEILASKSGLYNDMLRHTFEDLTGLYTSLGTMGR